MTIKKTIKKLNKRSFKKNPKRNLIIKLKSKDLILDNSRYFIKKLKKRYKIQLKSQRSITHRVDKTVVNRGPVCHSKSKESYYRMEKINWFTFSSQNLARSFQFLIEGQLFFFKKGSNRFKLSMKI